MTEANCDSVSVPSRDEIAALVRPMEVRTKRTARALALWLLISSATIAAGVSGLMAYQDRSLTSEAVTMGIMVFFFFGVLATVAVRSLILRDLRWIPALVRDGKVIPATIASHRVVANGIHQLVVLWKEGNEEVGAHFDVDQLRGADSVRDVTIVSSGRRQVGVVLNGQLYIALRNNPRFLRWQRQQTPK